jgi:hypothetical protein
MITLKQLKDKLEQDFGWENLDCEDKKWFVDHLLNDAIEAIEVIHCCKSDSELLKDKEVKCFDDFLELYCEQKEKNKWLYRGDIWSYDYIIQTYKELYKTL